MAGFKGEIDGNYITDRDLFSSRFFVLAGANAPKSTTGFCYHARLVYPRVN